MVFWAAGLHMLQDVPALLTNLALHNRYGAAWDKSSQALLALTCASLLFNLPWHIWRICAVTAEDDDLSDPEPMRAKKPVRTLRKVDTSKYVGLNSTYVIGMASQSELEA